MNLPTERIGVKKITYITILLCTYQREYIYPFGFGSGLNHTKTIPKPYQNQTKTKPKPYQNQAKTKPKPYQNHTKTIPKPYQKPINGFLMPNRLQKRTRFDIKIKPKNINIDFNFCVDRCILHTYFLVWLLV